MNKPLHVAPIGAKLPPSYFNPGTVLMHGKIEFSKWAIAYFNGAEFRFERETLGGEWVRVK